MQIIFRYINLIKIKNNILYLDILINAQNSNGGGGDKINSLIENAIIEERDPFIILRLIILQSLSTSKGLKSHVVNAYRKLFVQVFSLIFKFFFNIKL